MLSSIGSSGPAWLNWWVFREFFHALRGITRPIPGYSSGDGRCLLLKGRRVRFIEGRQVCLVEGRRVGQAGDCDAVTSALTSAVSGTAAAAWPAPLAAARR
jgi:hypothetical protein